MVSLSWPWLIPFFPNKSSSSLQITYGFFSFFTVKWPTATRLVQLTWEVMFQLFQVKCSHTPVPYVFPLISRIQNFNSFKSNNKQGPLQLSWAYLFSSELPYFRLIRYCFSLVFTVWFSNVWSEFIKLRLNIFCLCIWCLPWANYQRYSISRLCSIVI